MSKSFPGELLDSFKGLNARQWAVLPFRVVLMLPLLFVWAVFHHAAAILDLIIAYLDKNLA